MLSMTDTKFVQRPEARQKRIQSFAFVIAAGIGVLLTAGFLFSDFGGFRFTRQIYDAQCLLCSIEISDLRRCG